MPSWHVHRFWCLSLGVSDDVCRRVDEVVDFGKEFKGYRVGHDWCRGSVGRFVLASLLFYQELGVDGVKAVILHCTLDYIESLLKGGFSHGEVLWRALAWIKFAGAEPAIHYISTLPTEEKLKYVLSQEWSYYNYLAMDCQIHLKEKHEKCEEIKNIITNVAQETLSFIQKNFNEIITSIKRNT
jgi:hypothetical protein